jgi:LuxR family transcriptional regulator, positive regulator of biofilm formation
MLRDILTQRGLSHREAEVAELVSKGLSNKEVASQLFVTEKTVKFHLTNIYKKMQVKSRAQLIVWCVPHVDFVSTSGAQAPAQAAATPISAAAPTIGNNNGNTGSSSI